MEEITLDYRRRMLDLIASNHSVNALKDKSRLLLEIDRSYGFSFESLKDIQENLNQISGHIDTSLDYANIYGVCLFPSRIIMTHSGLYLADSTYDYEIKATLQPPLDIDIPMDYYALINGFEFSDRLIRSMDFTDIKKYNLIEELIYYNNPEEKLNLTEIWKRGDDHDNDFEPRPFNPIYSSDDPFVKCQETFSAA